MEKWIIVSSIATVVIAFWGGCSLFLALKIKTKDDEYRQQISDLFQAIVISNLIVSEKEEIAKIRKFHALYIGKTKIFINDTLHKAGIDKKT